MAARRHSSAQGTTTTRRASRDATSVSRRTSTRARYFVLFFSRARGDARLDDARGRRGAHDARRSSPDRDRIEIRARRRDRHPSVTASTRAGWTRARRGFARVIGRRRSSATRDASMKVASTTGRSHPRIHRHPSIDATAARGCRWLFFLSRERWFGGTKRGVRACVRACVNE